MRLEFAGSVSNMGFYEIGEVNEKTSVGQDCWDIWGRFCSRVSGRIRVRDMSRGLRI